MGVRKGKDGGKTTHMMGEKNYTTWFDSMRFNLVGLFLAMALEKRDYDLDIMYDIIDALSSFSKACLFWKGGVVYQNN